MRAVSLGKYVNFTVQRVITDSCGARSYHQQKYAGQVIATIKRDNITTYKIQVHNSNEIHEVQLYKITHVWYIV